MALTAPLLAELSRPPLEGLDLPLELEMRIPAFAEGEDELGEPLEVELRVRLGLAAEGAEWPSCAAARTEFRAGWGDEVAPAVRVAGYDSYSFFGDGLEAGFHLEIDERWDDEVSFKSSREMPDAGTIRLCFIGAGSGVWSGTGYEGLHFREDETTDLVVVLFTGTLSAEAAELLAEQLGLPPGETDARGLLVTINEAGVFSAVLGPRR